MNRFRTILLCGQTVAGTVCLYSTFTHAPLDPVSVWLGLAGSVDGCSRS